jgi:hypothetical protein
MIIKTILFFSRGKQKMIEQLLVKWLEPQQEKDFRVAYGFL